MLQNTTKCLVLKHLQEENFKTMVKAKQIPHTVVKNKLVI